MKKNVNILLDDNKLQPSVDEILGYLGIKRGDGVNIWCERGKIRGYQILADGQSNKLIYGDRRHFYTGLADILARLGDKYEEKRELQIAKMGSMLDTARNAVFKFEYYKRFLVNMAMLGYTFLEIYLEDCVEIEGQEYMGHLRGRYTAKEIAQIEGYAELFGVEIIPNIQTLAHYSQLFVWDKYEPIHDVADILLCENDDTYAFLDSVICGIGKIFKSRTINIGMDEAHLLGLGKYLEQNGYAKKYDILTRHVERVGKICKKYNLHARMWSDMYYRFAFGQYYCPDKDFTEEQVKAINKDIDLVYWNYDFDRKEDYQRAFTQQKQLKEHFVFAACATNWLGFAPFNRVSEARVLPGIEACKEFNADFMLTSWGGNGNECSHFATISTYIVASEKCFNNEIEYGLVDKKCRLITGYTYDELISMDLPNKLDGGEDFFYCNPSKYLLYNDALLSQCNLHIRQDFKDYYRKYAEQFKNLSRRKSYYNYLFKFYHRLCDFLTEKSVVSVDIKRAYEEKDAHALRKCSAQLSALAAKLSAFHESYRQVWQKECKPNGFEIADLRLGGAICRLKSCRKRLNDYLSGKIKNLSELEFQDLPRQCGFDFSKENLAYLCEDFITAYTVGVVNKQ